MKAYYVPGIPLSAKDLEWPNLEEVTFLTLMELILMEEDRH